MARSCRRRSSTGIRRPSFLDNRYHTKETWQDKDGKDLHPQQAYFVGGQTKVYGAAMFRMRAEDFGVIQHQGGISPAWPISYADLEPYYTRAEELFHVHGNLGTAPSIPGGFGSSFDPTEPFHSKPYPFPAFSNEARMQTIEDDVRKIGINTFPIPLGLKRNEADLLRSKCVRCDTCDGYPCLVHAKSDADINCIRQILALPNVTLMTNSRVTRLATNATGTAVTAVEVLHSGSGKQYGGAAIESPTASGSTETYTAGFFAVCAGAINSAVLLLASANDKHSRGLANSSDQVGRNFMYHQADALLALSPATNKDSYTKTWGTNDFYLKDTDPAYPFPLGQVQPVGSFHFEMMKGDAPPLTPGFVLEDMKHHAVPWWLTTEDLPDPENPAPANFARPSKIPFMPASRTRLSFAFALFAASTSAFAQPAAPAKPEPPQNAPSPLPPTRAEVLRGAYGPYRANNDLLYYHLDIRVDPVAKTIAGSNTVRFKMLEDGARIQLDLTSDLRIDKISLGDEALTYSRDSGAVFVDFPRTLRSGQIYSINVAYSGAPKSKGRFGGMSYETDPAGRPWIFTADEDDGCSIWWPCKDQWRDEPQEGMDISVAVPDALTDVSNGRFVSKVPQKDGYTQWNWRVSYPINSYDVALNIGAYTHFSDTYKNPPYPPLPLDYYCLPEDLAKAQAQFPQARDMLDAFEHYFGEYPFARDGYKLVQVPYSGMEHQTAVAYGNGFVNGYFGDWTGVGLSTKFDFIIIHESGHEWFGNAVTAADRSDMWIHEGWDTYLEALFVEYKFGAADALTYLNGIPGKDWKPSPPGEDPQANAKTNPHHWNGVRSHVATHDRRPIVTERGVAGDPPQDQYFKGAMMLNTLRSIVAPRRPEDDHIWFTDIRAFYDAFKYKQSMTEEVVAWWNRRTGLDLTPFFNQYLRRVAIPCLELNFDPATQTVLYKWQADEPNFAMPVQVGDPAHYQTIHPTLQWQSLPTKLTPEQFKVATDLYYVNVSKT